MDELVMRLRYCSEEHSGCGVCELSDNCVLQARLLLQAADAIEELLASYRTAEEAGVYLLKANEGMKRKNEWLHAELGKALESKPKWIPVTERLPKEYEEVLVYTRTGNVLLDRLEALVAFSIPDFRKLGVGAVTHWMPLPEPPKEET